jgi:hypothetical protein
MIEAWFRASEKIAILSSPVGFLPAAKRELILPRAVITAILAENPVGQRRQSCKKKLYSEGAKLVKLWQYELGILRYHTSFFFNSASDSSTNL